VVSENVLLVLNMCCCSEHVLLVFERVLSCVVFPSMPFVESVQRANRWFKHLVQPVAIELGLSRGAHAAALAAYFEAHDLPQCLRLVQEIDRQLQL
jgi:hypothetical protein